MPTSPPDAATRLAVILAAGAGSRLAAAPDGPPKPLVPVLGMPVLERAVRACGEAGIDRVVVVVGHRGSEVRAWTDEFARRGDQQPEFVVARDWDLGNGASALAARSVVGDSRFLLMMCDHLASVRLLSRVLEWDPPEGGICMAVDRDEQALFDEKDATKVRLHDGHVIGVGKKLVEWDAIDAGVFHCTPALFAALHEGSILAEHSLSTAIDLLASANLVDAVDITGDFWFDVDTEAGRIEAERLIRRSLGKVADDGYIAANLNRPLSTRLTARLADTAIRPNHVTIAAFLLALAAAGLFATGTYGLEVLGALLLQGSSILDGVDGELARLKHLSTPGGAWLDTIMDRYADVAVALGVTIAAADAAEGSNILVWIGGVATATGFILASYVTKEFELRHGRAYPNDILAKLKKRDLRLFTISVGALLGSPYLAAVGVGVLSHLCILGILARGLKEGKQTLSRSRF
jgi:1L-myo-inositol 1-phosphate cytidylyltransferase / CDP-L-myo-inositol myo-inositolphosphotransferase